MGNIKTDMMLWLGDNVYLRAPDYTSSYGIQARYSKNFATPELQKLRATRSNIAIWDDHDYGPNDAVKNYELKDETYNAFVDYWGNKTFGENDNKGIYSLYSWYDCDFLLMDDRFHRDANELPDSIDGKANPNKRFWGEKQFEWLKTSLISSDANFKFICTGNQVLNPDAQKECVRHYPYEFNELIDFIIKNKISGVVFLTGDRHFSELIKYQPAGSYPMYDFTCSSITSSIHKIKDAELNNPYRVPSTLLEVNNFGRISISGVAGKRELKMETLDIDGKVRWTYSVNQSQLKF
jgi:alkaline phosphatase D